MTNARDNMRLKEFGENLRRIRRSRNLTQKELAFGADVEVSQISRIENGIINTTVTTILQLAEAMDVPPARLFEYRAVKGKK
jgi:transcriptional regulator with XRE-family HTH domain